MGGWIGGRVIGVFVVLQGLISFSYNLIGILADWLGGWVGGRVNGVLYGGCLG